MHTDDIKQPWLPINTPCPLEAAASACIDTRSVESRPCAPAAVLNAVCRHAFTPANDFLDDALQHPCRRERRVLRSPLHLLQKRRGASLGGEVKTWLNPQTVAARRAFYQRRKKALQVKRVELAGAQGGQQHSKRRVQRWRNQNVGVCASQQRRRSCRALVGYGAVRKTRRRGASGARRGKKREQQRHVAKRQTAWRVELGVGGRLARQKCRSLPCDLFFCAKHGGHVRQPRNDLLQTKPDRSCFASGRQKPRRMHARGGEAVRREGR